MLTLRSALRMSEPPQVAFVGAGGKTTAMFSLARQFDSPVIVSATAHMGSWELIHADTIYRLDMNNETIELENIKPEQGVILFIGPLSETDRYAGLTGKMMEEISSYARLNHIPLLLEADGSRMRPLKAPASHEPPIPEFVDHVVVVAGMSAVGRLLTDGIVHRPEIFSELSGISPGDLITPEGVVKVLCHPQGGQKNIPSDVKKILLLNQADTPSQQKIAQEIAQKALPCYESVIVASLGPASTYLEGGEHLPTIDHSGQKQVSTVHEHIAGVILAAGESQRFGQPKQIVDWDGEPLIRKLAGIAVASGLSEVYIVLGANAEQILPYLEDLKIIPVYNPDWEEGQSSSIRAGIRSLDKRIHASIFILADQPFVSIELIHNLVAEHNVSLETIIAPMVDGHRGNPVLFDRITFPDLLTLSGNEGGRAIFNRYSPHFIKWQDPRILMDIDTPEDYLRLKNLGNE